VRPSYRLVHVPAKTAACHARLLENKYYVPMRIYEVAINSPDQGGFARKIVEAFFDIGVIDGTIHTSAARVVSLDEHSYMQLGYVRAYAAIHSGGCR